MITLCKCVGGSHMYGLNTPESDYDERYVFLNDDLAKTIGMDRFEHLDERDGEDDKMGYELRRFLGLLRKTNTQVAELVFADHYLEVHPLFNELIIKNRLKLLDTVKMFKSLRGYIHGERRLANGERTGTLGGKRKAALEKYGFSYKNFVQLIRLCYCGRRFFNDRVFPADIKYHAPLLAKKLIDLKTNPGAYTKEDLNKWVDDMELELVTAFDNRVQSYDLKFDEQLANEILLEFYFPVLAKHYANLKLK